MDQPFVLMIAGPNGSGKTTLTNWLREQDIDFGEYINPDDIAAELEGAYDERTIEAQRIADERRDACITARRSFSFETVMSHPSKLDILARAREVGFFVQLFFVGTDDPQTNVDRVALRVAQGGHSVPEEKIVSRWQRTMEQLSEAIRAADQVFVFDNSIAGTIETVPRLVFRRSFTKGRNLPTSGQAYPLPNWVRRYVLGPLGIGSSTIYPAFARPLPSLISLPIVTTAASEPEFVVPSSTHDAEDKSGSEPRIPVPQEDGAESRGLQSLSSALVSAVDTMAQAYARDGMTGLSTGINHLDDIMGGFQQTNLIVVAGRAGVGKTSLAINIAYSIASSWRAGARVENQTEKKRGGIVGLFSFELSSEQVATRVISAQTEIPTRRITGGDFAIEDFDRIAKVARNMETIPLYIDDTGGLSITQLAARANQLSHRHGLDLLVIDTVQALQGATGRIAGAAASRMVEIAAGLKSLAKELKIPVLAVSRLAKPKNVRDRRIRFEVDAALEEDADVILIVNREDQELREQEPIPGTYEHFQWQTEMERVYGTADLIIRKNRHGPTGTVHLLFDAAIGRFRGII